MSIIVDYNMETGRSIAVYTVKTGLPKVTTFVHRVVWKYIPEQYAGYLPYADAYTIESIFRRNIHENI